MKRKGIAIYGATGSIGTQALEVIAAFPDRFYTSVLTANNNYELLIRQALKFKPNCVVIANDHYFKEVDDALFSHGIKVYTGSNSLTQTLDSDENDIILNALLGFAGLKITIEAIRLDKSIALANKESLVVAGKLIREQYANHKANIIPVDSEHSAIYQCLTGEYDNEIEQIILTASGGPFRKSPVKSSGFTPENALKHPCWKMGDKISIDSATLINKGFEVIESMYLFNLTLDQIKVLIHPESLVHSLVSFADGSVKAQLSYPDMKIPLQYAFSFPERIKNEFPRIDFSKLSQLHFEQPDFNRFPNLELAFEAARKAGNMPCILNAGNEIAVSAFLQNHIKFEEIFRINEACMNKIDHLAEPQIEDIFETDKATRSFANSLIK